MSPLSSPTEPMTYSILEFNALNAERLALHLAEFVPSTVGRSLEYVAVKKLGGELGNDDHKNKWTAR